MTYGSGNNLTRVGREGLLKGRGAGDVFFSLEAHVS